MAAITVENGQSIQAAIDNANDGDEIIVKKGVYNECLCIEKEITLKGESESRDEMPVVWNDLGDEFEQDDAVIRVTSKCTVQNLIVRGLETGTSQDEDFYDYEFLGYDSDCDMALVLVHGDANFKNVLVQDSMFYGIVINYEVDGKFENCEVERTNGVLIGVKSEGFFTNCLLHDNQNNLEMHDYCYGGYFTNCKLYNAAWINASFYDGEIEFKNCEIYGAYNDNLYFQNTPEQRYTNRQNSPWGDFENCKIHDSKESNIRAYNPEEEEYDNEGITFSDCEIHDSKSNGVSIDNFPLSFCNCKFYNNACGDVSDDMGLGYFDECEMEGGSSNDDDEDDDYDGDCEEEENRFCENCGTRLRESDNFCPNCGARVGEDSSTAPEQPTTSGQSSTNNSPLADLRSSLDEQMAEARNALNASMEEARNALRNSLGDIGLKSKK